MKFEPGRDLLDAIKHIQDLAKEADSCVGLGFRAGFRDSHEAIGILNSISNQALSARNRLIAELNQTKRNNKNGK